MTALSVERAPNLPMVRPVETSGGRKPVSVADGYRLILAFPDRDPFVNLKIERSAAKHYVLDKQTILEQMQFMAASAKGVAVKLERSQQQGIDVAALNNPTLDGPTISFYSLFNDETETIVTAYILNQLPEKRSFQDLKQYRSQRDRFVADLLLCLTSSTFR